MNPNPEDPVWRRCEVAWMAHLAADGWLVTRLADAVNNFGEAGAPLMQVDGRLLRAPDLQTTRDGRTEFWEVKFRSGADIDTLTGQSEYWVSFDSFRDYFEIANVSGAPVRIILYDGEVWENSRKWLVCDVGVMRENGRSERRYQADGQQIDAWVWPASVMGLIDGPSVLVDPLPPVPLLQPIAEEEAFPDEVVTLAERVLRRRSKSPTSDDDRLGLPPGIFDILLADSRVRLDALRRSLGVPSMPLYSVLRFGLDGVDVDELLALMRYGVRLFLVCEKRPESTQWLEACTSARLFEWAESAVPSDLCGWVVDGRISNEQRRFLSDLEGGNFNFGQFVVVHEEVSSDVLVSAGAGSGKTETMAERIVFLLATARKHLDPRNSERPLELSLSDIVLITFTREAASEMRSRIARTILLRQRLCDFCALPATAWMLALGQMEIETIHTYSKKIIQRDGNVIGLAPSYKVGALTMAFRRLIEEEMSSRLGDLMLGEGSEKVPPFHELREQVERLWRKLSGTGFSPLARVSGSGADIQWGAPIEGIEGKLAGALGQVVYDVAERFSEVCARHQTIPVDELVPSASLVVSRMQSRMRKAPRFLFVDEFQDTDSEQIGMIVSIRQSSRARLFVVGDQKQGVYRFRGAEGNAFGQLQSMASTRGFELKSFELKLNFRSTRSLLDSMHPFFHVWGDDGYLAYEHKDRLIATAGGGEPLVLEECSTAEIESVVVRVVESWLAEIETRPNLTIGVLCRRNEQANKARKWLQSAGIACEIRVGGEFFRSPVVIEARVLLEAVLDPGDDAALLELAETRWFPGLATAPPPTFLAHEEKISWDEGVAPLIPWSSRFTSLMRDDRFDRADLDRLRERVLALGRHLQNLPVLAWLIECRRTFRPELVALTDPTDHVERSRYSRGFDQLVTQLDEEFRDSPLSPHLLLDYLRQKIATDNSVDESSEERSSAASVTALTVHKSKGLEYDFVLIPFTRDWFLAGSNQRDESIVVTDGVPRFIWKWVIDGNTEFTNVSVSELGLWTQEHVEKIKEEARLLYVAMTRAREKLEIIVPTGSGKSVPSSWGDLVKLVDR